MSEVMRVSVNRPLQHGDVAKVYDMDDDEAFVAVLNARDGVVSLSDPRDWGVCNAAFPLGGRFQVLALFELDGKPYRIERGMEVRWCGRVMKVQRVDQDGVPLTLKDDDDELNYANSVGVVNSLRERPALDLLGFRHPVKATPPSAKVYVRAGKMGSDCRVEVETPDGSRYVLPVIRGTVVMDHGELTTAEMTMYVEGTEAPDDET